MNYNVNLKEEQVLMLHTALIYAQERLKNSIKEEQSIINDEEYSEDSKTLSRKNIDYMEKQISEIHILNNKVEAIIDEINLKEYEK